MAGIEYILFDLDGTLTNPKEGITKSVQYALSHYGIIEEDLDRLTPFIGPPLAESYMRFYGFSPEQAREGIYVYREYFNERGWKENRRYPGMEDMLAALSAAGKKLYVATSKPENFAVRILDYFGLSGYFTFIGGASEDETRVEKEAVIRYVLARAGVDKEAVGMGRVLMVGDREHDVLGAHACGLACVGVLYGFGSRQELTSCGADYLAASVKELKALLLDL